MSSASSSRKIRSASGDLSENPYPGRSGITTSKASSVRPPYGAGSVSIGMIFRESVKRSGIAMCQDERKRLRAHSALMDEVNADTIHGGLEMSELVQSRPLFAPIVVVLPVGDELPEVVQIGAGIPFRAFDLIRPSCILEPPAQVDQHIRGGVDPGSAVRPSGRRYGAGMGPAASARSVTSMPVAPAILSPASYTYRTFNGATGFPCKAG